MTLAWASIVSCKHHVTAGTKQEEEHGLTITMGSAQRHKNKAFVDRVLMTTPEEKERV